MPRVTKTGDIKHAQKVDVKELSEEQLNNLIKNPERKKNKKLIKKLELSTAIVGGSLGTAMT